MIYDRLSNCEQYYILGDKFKKAFEFLKNANLTTLADGSYEIDGKEIYANVQSLKQNLLKKKNGKFIDAILIFNM